MPLDALYSAATGMLAQQSALDAISNNLANVNTPGFKRGRASFADLLYTELTPQQAAKQGSQEGLESCLALSEFIELFPIIDACAPPTIFELTQLIDEEPTRLSSVKQAL